MKPQKPQKPKRKLNQKIMSYRLTGKAIISGADTLLNQISLGHRYQNKLIENELARRKAIQEARDYYYPQLAQWRQQIEDIVAEIAVIRTKISDDNAKARSTKRKHPETKQIKALKAKIKPLSQAEKALRSKANVDPNVLQAWAKVEPKHNISKKGNGLRKEFVDQGLHSGTYQQIERQVPRSGPAPHFQRWTGEGKVRVYLGQQGDVEFELEGKHLKGGYSPEAIMNGDCDQCRIEKRTFTADHGSWTRDVCTLRVANQSVEVMFLLDRPLQGEIREVALVRKKIATHFRWELQFTVASPEPFETPWQRATAGSVGIDVGYRIVGEERDLRVAYWAGSDGDHGEIIIPRDQIDGIKRVESLQSTRATNYNAILLKFKSWLITHTHQIPDWLKDRTKSIHHWQSQSQARLASILLHWRANRFPKDEIYEELEAWRHQDKHLYDWQEYQRKHVHRWRDSFFRCQLQALAKRYKTAILEDSLPNFRNRLPEDTPDETVKRYRNLASNGRFLALAKETFAAYVEADAAYTTMRCHKCKTITEDLNKADLICTCGHCGAKWDQDENAAKNLLTESESIGGVMV